MPLLPARHYESEHTRFMRELMDAKPQLATEQKKGRAIWWDKTPAQLALRRLLDEGRVKMKAYVYGSE
jgi:hypothetical protein